MDTASTSEPAEDLSVLTFDQLTAFAERPGRHRGELEGVREISALRAYRSEDGAGPAERRQWAKLSLRVNARLHGDGSWGQARMAQNDFMLRAWIIDRLGPDAQDPDWDPDVLAADTLAELSLSPAEAGALGARWRALPAEQIGELRRLKNLTGHLDLIIGHLRPGRSRDELQEWLAVRPLLP
ncbi:hypothetical protein [Kitasatospora sp. NPDC091276]|uniref:hypothetical protein n=1 Tax=Kitasatospora sp. NPDC091276 TaxID=3155300 RepID=UPI003424FC07